MQFGDMASASIPHCLARKSLDGLMSFSFSFSFSFSSWTPVNCANRQPTAQTDKKES